MLESQNFDFRVGLTLICVARRHPYVSGVSRLDDVVKSMHLRIRGKSLEARVREGKANTVSEMGVLGSNR